MKDKVNRDQQIEALRLELADFKKRNFDIGIHDISENMKTLVNEYYGDEDWSASGFWIRAQQIIAMDGK